tara:strand:+ start:1823 stop:3736 length:1914 start_codon:yes stop_codon:yes gene_type:complete
MAGVFSEKSILDRLKGLGLGQKFDSMLGGLGLPESLQGKTYNLAPSSKFTPMFVGKDKGLGSFTPPEGGFPTRIGQIGSTVGEILDYLGEGPGQFVGGIGKGVSDIADYLGDTPTSTKRIQKEKALKFMSPFDEGQSISDEIQAQLNAIGYEPTVTGPKSDPKPVQDDLGEKTNKESITGATTDIDVRSPILPEQELREGEDEQTGVEDDTPKGDDQSDAFTEAMKSIEDISTGEESGVKGLDYYKKQFADATGIDISGKPDTRAATIAFGLALMQNKAGKGFNIGRMLSSVGEAGEKALPLAEAARKEARAAQVSAGTYALQERKAAIADAIDRQQKKVDAVLAIEKEFRGYENQKELERIKAATKIKVEILKQEAETLKNINDKKLEFTYKGFEIGAKTEKTPVSTQKEMKVTTGVRKSDGQMVFPFAEQEASQFATGLGQLEKATSTLDEIERNVQSIIDGGGSVTLEKATDIANNILSALGADYSIYKDEDGKTATGKITTNQILQDRLISQFKRFLTQETGNGISTKDLETVKQLIGQVGFFTNPAAALKRIQEVRDIFDTPKQQILTQLEQFADPKKHLNEDAFNNTMKIINDAALGASKFGGKQSFDEDEGEYTRDDDGNIFIDLTNMAN